MFGLYDQGGSFEERKAALGKWDAFAEQWGIISIRKTAKFVISIHARQTNAVNKLNCLFYMEINFFNRKRVRARVRAKSPRLNISAVWVACRVDRVKVSW